MDFRNLRPKFEGLVFRGAKNLDLPVPSVGVGWYPALPENQAPNISSKIPQISGHFREFAPLSQFSPFVKLR